MKIFLTGADGMLGSSIMNGAKDEDYSFFACSHTNSVFPYKKIDINNFRLVKNKINTYDPDVIIHLAALTDVDYCEVHPKEAYQINTFATKNIADHASACGIPIVFLSTGAVFDGKSTTSYKENDKLHPINVYGQTKQKAEEYVREFNNNLIIRTGWLIGGSYRDKKFVGKILQRIGSHTKELQAVSDIFGSPTTTDDLAVAVLKLVQMKAVGTFHVANEGIASRYEIAQEVLFFTEKQKEVFLKSVRYGFFGEVAPRPKMEALNTSYVHERYNIQLRSWKKALQNYLRKKIK